MRTKFLFVYFVIRVPVVQSYVFLIGNVERFNSVKSFSLLTLHEGGKRRKIIEEAFKFVVDQMQRLIKVSFLNKNVRVTKQNDFLLGTLADLCFNECISIFPWLFCNFFSENLR